MAATLVEGAFVLECFQADGAPVLHPSGAVLVEGGVVQAVGPFAELAGRHPGAQRVGGPACAVIPGLVNAHHHVGLTPLQLGSPDLPLELWFASRLALRDVPLFEDTLFSAFEMLASGVTTVQHLHSRAPGTPDDVLASAREVLRAYHAIGMRASYSLALRDQNRLVYEADQDFVARLPPALRPAMEAYFARFTLTLADQAAVFRALHAEYANDPLIQVQVAPSNLHWLSDAALELAGTLSDETGAPMHMHLLETPYQKAYAARRTGGSALAHLHAVGLTGPRLTLGHGVWMTEADIELCGHTGTRVCHNCSSNFRLKSGVAPLNRFQARGIPVAIGMDEAGINDDRDMLQEMRLVLHVHREPGIDAPCPTAAGVLRMATEGGAGTTPFGDRIGRLTPGCAADVVVLDWDAVTYPYQNPDLPLLDVLVARAKSQAVRTVMVGGDTVYDNGRFTRVDRDAVLREIAGRMRQPLTAAEESRRTLARDVMPHLRRFYDGYLDSAP